MKAIILPALLLAMTWTSAPSAAPVVVSVARPVIVSRPVTVSRPVSVTRTAPVMRNVPTTNYNGSVSNMMPLYAMLLLNSGTTGARESVEVATPLLTICTREQFAKAKAWQEDCRNLENVSASYCPLLSYFRHCKEAAPGDVQDLKPAGEGYRHVFLTN